MVSTISNFGENGGGYFPDFRSETINFYTVEPDLKLLPAENERNKRNFGLQKAKELGYTHFLMMDADEFYEPSEFLKEKENPLK